MRVKVSFRNFPYWFASCKLALVKQPDCCKSLGSVVVDLVTSSTDLLEPPRGGWDERAAAAFKRWGTTKREPQQQHGPGRVGGESRPEPGLPWRA